MAKSAVHIISSGQGWAVREGKAGPEKIYATKEEAIQAGGRIAAKNRSEQIIHNHEGRIVERNTYSRDPFPPASVKSRR